MGCQFILSRPWQTTVFEVGLLTINWMPQGPVQEPSQWKRTCTHTALTPTTDPVGVYWAIRVLMSPHRGKNKNKTIFLYLFCPLQTLSVKILYMLHAKRKCFSLKTNRERRALLWSAGLFLYPSHQSNNWQPLDDLFPMLWEPMGIPDDELLWRKEKKKPPFIKLT